MCLKVLVECKTEELLVRLLLNDISPYHLSGKGKVSRALRDKFEGSVAIVDEDPGSAQPQYLAGLETVDELKLLYDKGKLKLLYDRDKRNAVAVIRPRFEEWVIGAAGEAGVRLKDLGLPTNPDELHRVLGANPQRAERLLKELRRRGCGRLEALTRLLREALKMARRGEP